MRAQEDVAVQGIKLSRLYEAFTNDIERVKDKTVKEFVDTILPNLMPRSDSERLYVDWLKEENSNTDHVGVGEVYVSFVYENNFLETMETLKDHFRNNPDIHICMDKVTHLTPSREGVFLIKKFEEVIRNIGYVVMVVSPWDNVAFYGRTAILFEILCAHRNCCKFEIALSSGEKKKLIDRARAGGAKDIQETLEEIDFNGSSSNFKSLEKLVLEKEVPLDIATSNVANVVRDCLVSISRSVDHDHVPKECDPEHFANWKKLWEDKNDIQSYEMSKDSDRDKWYQAAKALIFEKKNSPFAGKDHLRSAMHKIDKSNRTIFHSSYEVFKTSYGERDPRTLRFLDLHVYSLILLLKWRKEDSDTACSDEDFKKAIKFLNIADCDESNRGMQQLTSYAENMFVHLMMLWESNVSLIRQDDSKTLTVSLTIALPRSFYSFGYHSTSSKQQKLLFLCLGNTEYGGVWRISWIGRSRKMIRCECTAPDAPNAGDRVSLIEDWELAEIFNTNPCDLSANSFVQPKKNCDCLLSGTVLKVRNESDGSRFDVLCNDGNHEIDLKADSIQHYSKSVYLKQRKDPPKSKQSQKWLPQSAFFAPIPKLLCSCSDYKLLGVDLSKQTFQAEMTFEFRLNEIGKDATCEKYVLNYLSRYGFDMSRTIDFSDEIISNSGTKATIERFTTYEESSSKSFLFDFKIQMRKQSEYKADLKMADFPFDQQKLSIEVWLNTPKFHIEMVPDSEKKVTTEEKLKEPPENRDESFDQEYAIIFSDMKLRTPWSQLPRTKSHWKTTFYIYIQRKYSFYILSAILPLILFCLLSFLTFGVLNNCGSIDTDNRNATSLTLLLSAVAFKMSISSFLPQSPYLTLLDYYMWALTSFIAVVAVENTFWPLSLCSKYTTDWKWEHEYILIGWLFALLVFMIIMMAFCGYRIIKKNNNKVTRQEQLE